MALTMRDTIPILIHHIKYYHILIHPIHLLQHTKQSIKNNTDITNPNMTNTSY